MFSSEGAAPLATSPARPWRPWAFVGTWPSWAASQQLTRLAVQARGLFTTHRGDRRRGAPSASAPQKASRKQSLSGDFEEASLCVRVQSPREAQRERSLPVSPFGKDSISREKPRRPAHKSGKRIRLRNSLFLFIMEEERLSFVYMFCSFVPLALLGLLLEAAVFVFSAVVQVQYMRPRPPHFVVVAVVSSLKMCLSVCLSSMVKKSSDL